MKIGVVMALYAALPLTDALDRVKHHGVEAVEFGAATFGGTAHVDFGQVVADDRYAEQVLDAVGSRGLVISALSCHGKGRGFDSFQVRRAWYTRRHRSFAAPPRGCRWPYADQSPCRRSSGRASVGDRRLRR